MVLGNLTGLSEHEKSRGDAELFLCLFEPAREGGDTGTSAVSEGPALDASMEEVFPHATSWSLSWSYSDLREDPSFSFQVCFHTLSIESKVST